MKNDFNQKLSAEYQAYMPNLRRFSNELIRQLQFLLNKNNIQLGVPIQTRIKNLINKLLTQYKLLTKACNYEKSYFFRYDYFAGNCKLCTRRRKISN